MAGLGYDDFVRMLRGAAAKVRQEQARLSQLDSVIGDGDHGTTMVRAMGLLEKAIGETGPRNVKAVLNAVGWAILGVDGGATGPLFGMFFVGLSEAAPETGAVDAGGLAAMFAGALASVRKQTKAQVGDKTLIDALVPAVEALGASAKAGDGPAAALAKAADAAEAGAASTQNLRARFGRARNLGDRSIGSADPGATSIAAVFRGMAEALAGPTP